MGGFDGVFKSTDGGKVWVHQDILLRTITDVQVAATRDSKRHMVTVCTYADGCWGGTFATTSATAGGDEAAMKQFPITQALAGEDYGSAHEYNVMGVPPNESQLLLRGRYNHSTPPWPHSSSLFLPTVTFFIR